MRVLIVDDEAIALDRLENAIACIPEAQLAGRATGGRQALALAREARPDVVLLDIQMPGIDGLAAAKALAELPEPPQVIFVTAFDQHAVRAFELHAADYLLKPVSLERLREALRRAADRLRAKLADRRFAELDRLIETLRGERASAHDSELWVRSGVGVERVEAETIELLRAEGDYVAVAAGGREHLVKDSLTRVFERLDPGRFVRVHRSTVVNMERVKGVRRRRPRGLVLVMQDGSSVEVGPSYAEAVQARLNTGKWR